MIRIIFFMLAIGNFANAKQTCTTSVLGSSRQEYKIFDWEVQSVPVTIKGAEILTWNNEIIRTDTPPMKVDLMKSQTIDKGFMFSLIGVPFPGESERVEVRYIKTKILTKPEPYAQLKDGSTCKINLIGGGYEFPDDACGPPGSLIYWFSMTDRGNYLSHDYNMIISEFAFSRAVRAYHTSTTTQTTCCSNGNCNSQAPSTKTRKECDLYYQCVRSWKVRNG